MKKILSAAFILTALLAVTAPAPAHAARGGVGIGLGGCCGYYPPGWGYYGYPSYYYMAPPPVVYVPPPTYYAAPAPVTYAAPPQQGAIPADQASPNYVNEQGQTCREYQTNAMVGGVVRQAYGTACLQPD